MERDKIVAHLMCAMELALEDEETYIDFVHLMLRLSVDIIEEDFEGSEELEMIAMEEIDKFINEEMFEERLWN